MRSNFQIVWGSGLLAIIVLLGGMPWNIALWNAFGSEPTPSVAIGTHVGSLRFKDIRFLERSLADFPNSKAFVIVCTNTTCPLVKRYLPVLKQLEQKYRNQGVQFLLLNVNAGDSVREMAAHALEYDVPFPAVKDVDSKCITALGMTRTPECVVVDSQSMLRYRGRIDDQFRIGGSRPSPTRNDLEEAIKSVLADQAVENPETPVDGCIITNVLERVPESDLTYQKNVAPILSQHCVECHQPGTEAPFSLLTYEDVTEQGEMIAEVVRDGRMPPWYASSAHNDFVNRRELSEQEQATIADRVRAEMPRGDSPADPVLDPPPQVNDNGWLIGEPDLVLTTPVVDTIPATGIVDYKYVVLANKKTPWLPHVFLRETWVDRVQINPDNNRAVHHCNLIAVPVVGDRRKDAKFVTGKVPGGIPLELSNGVSFRIPAGYIMIVQIHYTTTGRVEKNRINVGFRFARDVVKKELHLLQIVNRTFSIPPDDPHYKVSASLAADRDIIGAGLFSHMHVRGKDMTFLAHYPDGRSETLLMIPNYNFGWQIGYQWHPDFRRFPAGTKFEVVAHYDNSLFNPFNPDPKATVTEGDQSFDEMMYGFFFYTIDGEELNLHIDAQTGCATSASSVD